MRERAKMILAARANFNSKARLRFAGTCRPRAERRDHHRHEQAREVIIDRLAVADHGPFQRADSGHRNIIRGDGKRAVRHCGPLRVHERRVTGGADIFTPSTPGRRCGSGQHPRR